MRLTRHIKRLLSLILTLSIVLSSAGCSKSESSQENTELSDPNSQIVVESIETENIETEDTLTEFITSEIYLEELILAEDKITEFLLEESTISEVMLCKTIYVPQGHIEDFAEHSQLAGLFGENVDLSSVLKKISVGTGVIVTLAVVKKAGLPDPIASAVVAAADKSLKFAKGGAAIGSLFGGLTGAAEEIDASGRTSAVMGFALAAAGLILSAVSLVTEIPSGGSTTITLAAGIKLVIAGVSVVGATGSTAYAGYNAIKTFTSTDASDIDWNNINWEKVGVSAAQKAIEDGSAGYMWGSFVGAVYGGAEGYDFYQKYNTPYSEYNERLVRTPVDGNRGHWSGARGESDFILDKPIVRPDGTKIKKVTYKNCVPDFSPFQLAQVRIPNMTNSRPKNYRQADQALAEYWTEIKYQGKTWTVKGDVNEIEIYRKANHLTWHEMNNMESMQLVPTEVNSTFGHLGGVSEYSAMIGQGGAEQFD